MAEGKLTGSHGDLSGGGAETALAPPPVPSENQPEVDSSAESAPTAARQRLLIVGNGMVSHRLCEALVALDYRRYDITVFAEESCPAYDRVHMGDVLAGRAPDSLLLAPARWYSEHAIDLRLGDAVVGLDLSEQTVLTAHGERAAYDKLVIATGSVPLIPPIKVGDWNGVFVLRTLDDVGRVHAAAAGARRAVIIGGGLLGLETASALKRAGLDLTIIEVERRLMSRQLDDVTAALLKQQLERMGLAIRLGTQATALVRTGGGQQVMLRDGPPLDADFVVIAAGVRPRDNLAHWGLGTGRRGGYAVNHLLQTSDPHVYAIGECASWNDQPIGVVAPGYAMAECLAHTLVEAPASFCPPAPSVRLKISGLTVGIAGAVVPGADPVIFARGRDWVRSLQLKDGVIVRAVTVGAWAEWEQVEDAIRRGCAIAPAQLHRFARGRRLFAGSPSLDQMSAEMIVCSCNSVTLGAVRTAMASGCGSLAALAARTHATTTCGACVDSLEQLMLPAGRHRGSHLATWIGGLVALLLVAVVAFGRPLLDGTAPEKLTFWNRLLRDPIEQQVTGFGVLGLWVAALLFPLRRLWPRARAHITSWRLVHVSMGTLAVATLVVHTGFRLGTNANRWLSIAFLVFAALGGLATFWRSGRRTANLRWLSGARSLHILMLWPALALLGLHVLAVYYF